MKPHLAAVIWNFGHCLACMAKDLINNYASTLIICWKNKLVFHFYIFLKRTEKTVSAETQQEIVFVSFITNKVIIILCEILRTLRLLSMIRRVSKFRICDLHYLFLKYYFFCDIVKIIKMLFNVRNLKCWTFATLAYSVFLRHKSTPCLRY